MHKERQEQIVIKHEDSYTIIFPMRQGSRICKVSIGLQGRAGISLCNRFLNSRDQNIDKITPQFYFHPWNR